MRAAIKCNAHAFLRTFAKESVRNCFNVFCVQGMRGHKRVTKTPTFAKGNGHYTTPPTVELYLTYSAGQHHSCFRLES